MRLPRAIWLAVVLVVLIPGGLSAAEPLVVGLQVVGDGISEPEVMLEVLGLAVGEPLDRYRLREGVHALFAGGEVEYLRVDQRTTAEGIHLSVHLRLRSRIDRLEIAGVGLLWRRRLTDWLELAPGGTVSAARVEVGVARSLRKLKEHGYADATVEPSIDFQRWTNTVELTITVDLGEPQRVVAVRVDGLPEGAETEQVLPKVRKGRRLTRRLLGRIRDDVEAAARRLGYWDAQVSGVDQLAEGAEITLVVRLASGPRFRVEVDSPPGTAELVEQAFPDPAEEEVHPAQTDVLAERIRENLQRKGYILAEVEIELSTEEPQPLLTVRARPGAILKISEVEFVGAEQLGERALRRGLEVKKGRTRGWRGREVTDSSLERDRAILEETYHRHGFADVQVDTPTAERDGEDKVRVVFQVHEGEQWVVEELRLEGFPVETVAALEDEKLTIEQGGPWQPDRIDFVCRRLEAALANTGYPAGRVVADVQTLAGGRARVVLQASPGPYVSIGKVAIAGLKTTKRAVVESVLVRAGVVQGEPYSAGAIVIAQRLLYELGLFRRVEVVPLPGEEHRLERGLVVRCEEGRARSYLVGVGWDNEARFRLTLGWSHLNLFGGAHAVSVETRFSDREVRFQAGYREAWLPLIHMPGYAALYRTEENYATYSQLRRGLWFEVGERRARPFRHWYRFEYQLVQPDAPDDVLSELEREDQEILLASVTPAIEWDTRDDPLNPRHGIFTAASLEYAFPLLQAEAEFLRAQASLVVYRKVEQGSLSFAVRVGAIEPLGPDTGEPANLQIPLSKRFFAGGRVTHRAFDIDTLGIPGQTLDENGNPIGGNGLFLINLEYRKTIVGALGAVVFVDGGNVWADYSEMRWEDMRWGVGAGVHYGTPAGPLRLEYGHKLDRQDGESSGEVFLSFGVAF